MFYSNEQLARAYQGRVDPEKKSLTYRTQANIIRKAKISIFDYYEEQGHLRELNEKGIGKKTIRVLEELLVKRK